MLPRLRPGELVWVTLDAAPNEAARIPHPHVIIAVEADADNAFMITLCGLTSNLHRTAIPGNILLALGEGGLPKPSVVEVGKHITVPRSAIGAVIGSLTPERVQQIRVGMAFQRRLRAR